jgi:dolichyl-phosphate-mannose-protein mannosyltransferase
LPDGGTYQASQQYKQILEEGRQSSPAAFPIMLRDSLGFLSHYSKGVPALNMCKSDENGSPFYLWPFGARTISYRWETPGNGSYRYLYLVPNPVGWALGLVGVILAVSFLLASVLMPLKNQLRRPYLLLVFLGMYISYMLAVSQLDRVMYLYHYFIPLLFSYILFVLSVEEIRTIGPWKLTEERRLGVLICLGLAVFVAFQWMRPLTYYGLLTNEQFAHRDLLNVWEMRCVQCERKNMLANPNDCSA